jgi:hypothetical protein
MWIYAWLRYCHQLLKEDVWMKHLILGLLLVGSASFAQDYPLKSTISRPKPLTATLVGVCEKRNQVLMVAIFTFDNGKTLVVDGQHMQGFADAADIVRYAATAASVNQYAQTCGDVST